MFNFLIILIIRFLFTSSNVIFLITVSGLVYELTENASMISFVLIGRVVGGILSSLSVTALFKNELNKNKLIICAVTLAMLFYSASLCYKIYLFIVFMTVIVGYITSSVTTVINSQSPNLLGKKYLVKFNFFSSFIASIASVIGAILAGTVIAFLGYHLIFLLCAISFVLCSLCISLIKQQKHASITNKKTSFMARQDIQQLLNSIKSDRVVLYMLLITALDCLASASHNIGFPFLAKHLNSPEPSVYFGLIWATWATGNIYGTTLFSCYLIKIRQINFYFIGIIFMSGGFILGFYQSVPTLSLMCLFIAGVGDGIIAISFITKAQEAENHLRMNLFSAISFMQSSGFALGFLITAPFFKILYFPQVITIFHVIPILAVIFYYSQTASRLACGYKEADR